MTEKRNATKIKNTQINYRQEILKDNPYLAEKVGCGYQDFQDFACGRQFYVDKTHFITEWLQSEAKVTLITRPRRFGKTTLLSTVENFLDPKFSDHPEHFEKFKVWRDEKSREWFGKIPVISVSFGSCKGNDYRQALRGMMDSLFMLYEAHDYLRCSEYLGEDDRNEYSFFVKLYGMVQRKKWRKLYQDYVIFFTDIITVSPLF